MTPSAATDEDRLDAWEDLEDQLARSFPPLIVLVGRHGPVVTLDLSGWRTGRLRVTDPRDQLRAQDRRRLHRLGLRPSADPPLGAVPRCWTWESRSVDLQADGPVGELVLARVQAWWQRERACRAQLVAVLREGLRLDPSQLTVLPVELDEPDEDEAEELDELYDLYGPDGPDAAAEQEEDDPW